MMHKEEDSDLGILILEMLIMGSIKLIYMVNGNPSWPEIIWFFCNKAPLNGGETIFCDGIELWNRLPSKIKACF